MTDNFYEWLVRSHPLIDPLQAMLAKEDIEAGRFVTAGEFLKELRAGREAKASEETKE